MGGQFYLSEDRVNLYLTLIKDLFFPYLSPRLRRMAEHPPEHSMRLALYWHGAVGTEDDGTGARVKQRCQTFAEFKLFLLVEEVEERACEDDRDVSS